MPAKKLKSNAKRYYHADGYTYDEYSKGLEMRNLTDFEKEKIIDKRNQMGGVGPERVKDYLSRLDMRKEYLDKNRDLRVLDTSQNKARGTSSSSTRKLIK